jgi:hypothetical protein
LSYALKLAIVRGGGSMAASKKRTKKTEPVTTPATEASQTEGKQNIRTTIVLPATVDENLGVYVLRNNTSRSEIITNLLIEFLTKEGYQPLKHPKLDVSY